MSNRVQNRWPADSVPVTEQHLPVGAVISHQPFGCFDTVTLSLSLSLSLSRCHLNSIMSRLNKYILIEFFIWPWTSGQIVLPFLLVQSTSRPATSSSPMSAASMMTNEEQIKRCQTFLLSGNARLSVCRFRSAHCEISATCTQHKASLTLDSSETPVRVWWDSGEPSSACSFTLQIQHCRFYKYDSALCKRKLSKCLPQVVAHNLVQLVGLSF